MSAIPLIKQGESFPFVFDLSGQDITGWTCTIFVKQFPEDVAIIQRVIPPQGRQWPGYLTQSETATFTPSSRSPWYIIGKLENTTTDQEIQIEDRFNVGAVWA